LPYRYGNGKKKNVSEKSYSTKNHFAEFYARQNAKAQAKIDYVFDVIETSEIVPSRFLRHITGVLSLYEIRIEYQGNIYRVFCCFDEGKLVVLFNAFQKKTEKTPQKEIEQAIRLKKEYFNSKNEQK